MPWITVGESMWMGGWKGRGRKEHDDKEEWVLLAFDIVSFLEVWYAIHWMQLHLSLFSSRCVHDHQFQER